MGNDYVIISWTTAYTSEQYLKEITSCSHFCRLNIILIVSFSHSISQWTL